MEVFQRPRATPPASVSHWLSRIREEDACPFPEIYGGNRDQWASRARLLRRTLERFGEAFGEREVRVFRAPGRINLRGMHVDTHGGYLNLMTHHREVVVVASTSGNGQSRFVNIAPEHRDITLNLLPWREHPAFVQDWETLITSPASEQRRSAWAGGWGVYIEGALLRAALTVPALAGKGLNAAVGSDLPAGAALSSSAALCVATILAALGSHGTFLPADDLMLAARDAEWFTGSRCGVSDQAAIILGRRGRYVHVALHGPGFSTREAKYASLPDGITVLVADSQTTRRLSGKAKLAYTRNRFAYSMALDILRQETASLGLPAHMVKQANHLSCMTPEFFGGDARLYHVVSRVPKALSLSEMRGRYTLPALDAALRQYFGDTPPEASETGIALRGPLLYGLAESERARLWPLAIQQGDPGLAGQLMTIGHDGDRVMDGSGAAFDRTITGDTLRALAEQAIPVALCPGDYGASTPVLDGLVDAALAAGALGASLTGAGLAGCVIALCRTQDAGRVAEGMRDWLASPDYARRAGTALPHDKAHAAMVENHATAGACALSLE